MEGGNLLQGKRDENESRNEKIVTQSIRIHGAGPISRAQYI